MLDPATGCLLASLLGRNHCLLEQLPVYRFRLMRAKDGNSDRRGIEA